MSLNWVKRILIVCAVGWLLSGAARGQSTPNLLIFPFAGDENLSASVTQAVKAILKQGQNVQVTEFRADIPSLKRAVIEKRISSSDLKSMEPAARARIAKALEAEYYIIGDASLQREGVAVKMTAVESRSGRLHEYESDARPASGSSNVGRDTLVISVANTVVSQFMTQVLGIAPPAAPPPPEAVVRQPKKPQGTSPEQPKTSTDKPEPPAPPGVSLPVSSGKPADLGIDADGYVVQAEAQAASGDLAGAIQSLRAASNLDTGNVDIRLRLSGLYERKGMHEEAVSELQRAVSLAPANPEARELLAKQLMNSGSAAEARKIYEDLLKENPNNIDARLALGDILWNIGKPDDAALEYAQAASDAPSNPGPPERLARLYASRGQFLEALASINTIQDIKKQDPNFPVEIGLYKSLIQSADVAFYKQRDLFEETRKQYEKSSITREDFFNKAKVALTEFEQLAEFLGDINPPADYAKSHLHRTLAASLLSQAVTSVQDWLRTDDDKRKAESEGFANESAKEMDAALDIDRRMKAGG